MACGLVCIGTNVEGINQIIEDGVSGCLAAGTDAQAIAEAINKSIQSHSDSIVREAVRKIRDEFSLQIVAEKENKIFIDLKA